MSNSTTLITAVATVFNLPNNIFIDMFLEEHIGCVRVEHQESYFKSLFGVDSEYKKPLDRVADATKNYRKVHIHNNYTLVNALADKIVKYLLSLYSAEFESNLNFLQKIASIDYSTHFTPVEFKAIEFAGGIQEYVHDGKICIDTNILIDCYNSAFFGEEPNTNRTKKQPTSPTL